MKNVSGTLTRNDEIQQIMHQSAARMRQWGITVTYLASQLGVSRQYAWQVMYYRTMISRKKALQVQSTVDSIIERQSHVKTFGDRLRAARISQGLTLKQVADRIGYSWVGVERWEKNICLPKPGVLFHLRTLYGVDENWLPPETQQHPLPSGTPGPWQSGDEHRRVA